MTDRTVFALTGTARTDFLQGLVTNDVTRAAGSIVYAALLTPQGKFIADFFVIGEDDRILMDVATSHAAPLIQRLNMYRLRADVQIVETGLIVSRGTSPAPAGALSDPRHTALGWRAYGDSNVSDNTDWDDLRVTHLIPETGIELTPDTYILEAGFEVLHGIDFRKGCYVGQEIAARMKHKTERKKGLRQVAINGTATPGDDITSHDKPSGILHTVSGSRGIAYLRFDRTADMQTKGASLQLAD